MNRVRPTAGMLTSSLPGGSSVRPNSAYNKPVTAFNGHPFLLIGPYKDGDAWKLGFYPGTLSGLTPVVGLVTGTGGDALTIESRLTLTTGSVNVVLGVKTNLETRAITRLTIETIEDPSPIVDTEARTRIAYIPIATLMEEEEGPIWSKTAQIATTNLNYFTAGTSDITWRA